MPPLLRLSLFPSPDHERAHPRSSSGTSATAARPAGPNSCSSMSMRRATVEWSTQKRVRGFRSRPARATTWGCPSPFLLSNNRAVTAQELAFRLTRRRDPLPFCAALPIAAPTRRPVVREERRVRKERRIDLFDVDANGTAEFRRLAPSHPRT